MLNVVGIVHAQGEYKGVKYDNYNLHCTREAFPGINEEGLITEIVKVKASSFAEYGIQLGATIDVAYDKYGRIKDISVI